ncbi:hypothetical protein KKA69_02780 [Patescibacteria group bacterium]|nr:hypothetical protein [Patescibacteria group bacterium]
MKLSSEKTKAALLVFLILLIVSLFLVNLLLDRDFNLPGFIKVSKPFVYPVNSEEIINVISKEGQLLFYLKEGTEIYPVIDGESDVGNSKVYMVEKEPEEYSKIEISDVDGRKMVYLFSGEVKVGSKISVTKEQKIPVGISGENPMGFFDNAFLVLSLYDSKGEQLPLVIKDFTKR